jgi:hypothetical protein
VQGGITVKTTTSAFLTYVSALLTASNGTTRVANDFRLGGALTQNTEISGAFRLNITANNFNVGTASASARINYKGTTSDNTAYLQNWFDSSDAYKFSIRNDGRIVAGYDPTLLGAVFGHAFASPTVGPTDYAFTISTIGLASGLFILQNNGTFMIGNIPSGYSLNYDGATSYSFGGALANVGIPSNTANRVLYSDASNNIKSSTVTDVELGYLGGVTSAIQTQINNINSGLSWKVSVRAATTANITLSGAQTIDGIAVIAGNRVLVKNQAIGADNGIYLCSAGAWTRTTDANTGGAGSTGILGATVVVEEGTISADFIYTCSTDAPITIGVTSLTFIKTSATTYVGTAGRISLTGNAFDIDVAYVGQTSINTLGTITTGTWNAGVISPVYGGTGIANNVASTLTITGNFATTFITTSASSYTLPTTSATLLANNLGLSGGSTLIGGTAVGDVLNLKGTSGNGTSTVSAINFLVGNNGATIAGKILNSGNWNIGNAADSLAPTLGIVRIGQGTSWIDIGQRTAGNLSLWANQATPSTTNQFFSSDGAISTLNGTTYCRFSINAVTIIEAQSVQVNLTPQAGASGSYSNFLFTAPNNTNNTASTVVNKFLYTIGSTQHATGAIAGTYGFVKYTQPTISFIGSSTATLTATITIAGAPNSGTNAIQTTAVGLLIESAAVNGTGTVGTSYGALINAQTGATTNFASGFIGNVAISSKLYIGSVSTTPLALLHLAAGGIGANGSPFKLTTQAAGLTTPEQGVMELINNTLSFTNLAVRRSVVQGQSVRTATATVANTTTETEVFSCSQGANYLTAGKQIEVSLQGLYTSISGAGANTLTVRIKYAGVTLVTLVTSEANNTDQVVDIIAKFTCRTSGGGGTGQIYGKCDINNVLTDPSQIASFALDTTTAQNLTITVQWSDASASNDIRITQGRAICVDNNI